MRQSVLHGQHSYTTESGVNVGIFQRGRTYIGRGRYERRAFGVTLGTNEADAFRELCQLLVRIDNGAFVRPSESRHRPLNGRISPNLSLRQLCDAFLAEKRATRGAATARTYLERLGPVLSFVEGRDSLRRWPLARDIDRDAILQLRTHLMRSQVTPNGKPGAVPKPISPRQIRNCLETLRNVLHWGSRPQVRKLPTEYVQPITPDLIGPAPTKDPLRKSLVPIADRIRMVQRMDTWQLLQLSILLVLPLRHEDVAGALITDVDQGLMTLSLGDRFHGNDFTKGRTIVHIPLPSQLRPILRLCKGGRANGPLFRSRRGYAPLPGNRESSACCDVERLLHDRLLQAPPTSIQTEQDRKRVLRELIKDLGGVSLDSISKELRSLLKAGSRIRAYELKASITQDMKEAGVHHLELRYLTGHSMTDILHQYTGLNPVGEMAKYFGYVKPLLTAIERRATELGLPTESE